MAGALLGLFGRAAAMGIRNWKVTLPLAGAGIAFRKEIGAATSEFVADANKDPIEAVKRAADGATKTGNAIVDHVDAMRAGGEKIAGFVKEPEKAAQTALEKVTGAASSAANKVVEKVTNEDGGWNWGKIFGWGGAGAAGLYGLSKFFGGNDKKAENNDNGFSFGNMLMMAAVAVGAFLLFQNRNELAQKFGLTAKNNEPGTSHAQTLTSDPTGRADVAAIPAPPAVAAVAPLTPSTTELGNQFGDAGRVTDSVRATADSPELQARAAIQKARVRSAGRPAGTPAETTVEIDHEPAPTI